MIDAPLAFAFTAGMVATVNPCGFAMLPAYLSYFMGLEDRDEDAPRSVARALAVGGAVSAGFLAVFGAAGLLITAGIRSFIDYLPWVAIVIGVGLVVLGVAMLAGRQVIVNLPKLERGTRGRGLSSVALFGVSYAVASLSCALPVFLVVVSGTVTRENLASGLAAFLAYALGMSLVLLVLTVALGLAKHSLVRTLRRAMPYIDRAAGALLIVAGAYIAYYWSYDLATEPDTTAGAGPIDFVYDLSADLATWVQETGGTRVGIVLGAVVVGSGLFALGRRS